MFNGINWPEIVAGFIAGVLPFSIKQIYILYVFFRQPGRRKFLGNLWHYHRSTTGSGEVYESLYRLSRSPLTGQISVRGREHMGAISAQSHLTYQGRLSKRQGMIRYFSLKDPGSHERMYWFVIDPFHDPFVITAGVYLALDLEGLPAAGPMLLSKVRLDMDWANSHLSPQVVRAHRLSGSETTGHDTASNLKPPNATA